MIDMHRFYVGANVEGSLPWKGDVMEHKAVSILRDTYGIEGLTITWTDGYWRGARESTMIVETVCSPDTARGFALDMARALQQESIVVVRLGEASIVNTEGQP